MLEIKNVTLVIGMGIKMKAHCALAGFHKIGDGVNVRRAIDVPGFAIQRFSGSRQRDTRAFSRSFPVIQELQLSLFYPCPAILSLMTMDRGGLAAIPTDDQQLEVLVSKNQVSRVARGNPEQIRFERQRRSDWIEERAAPRNS